MLKQTKKRRLKRHHILGLLISILPPLCVGVGLFYLNTHHKHNTFAAPLYNVPSSIPDNCSSDVTAQLNSFFAGVAANSVINFPTNGCYVVSNSVSSVFILKHTSGLTVNGNGSTLKQTSYSSQTFQPILSLGNNTNLTINNLTMLGPHSGGGDNYEGDYGVYMYQNGGVNLNGITVNNVDGDGMAIYPYGNTPGVNWNVVVNNSTIENVGYHAITPEAVHGFTLENSTVTNGDVDAEVDWACPANNLAECGTLDNPNIGAVDMTFKNNYFPNGFILLQGMSCMPIGNWSVIDNNLGSGGMDLEFGTSYNTALASVLDCGRPSGLTITGNTSTNSTLHPCCGSGSTYFILQGWQNVNFSNNNLVYDPGQSRSGPVDLWYDNNVTIENNKFINLYNFPPDLTGGAKQGWPPSTNVTDCGNVYGTGGSIKQYQCPKASLSLSSQNITRGSPASLTAVISSQKGNPPIASVEFVDNFTPLATIRSAPYTYDWKTPSTLSIGNHVITAIVTDASGNKISTSATVNITASTNSSGSTSSNNSSGYPPKSGSSSTSNKSSASTSGGNHSSSSAGGTTGSSASNQSTGALPVVQRAVDSVTKGITSSVQSVTKNKKTFVPFTLIAVLFVGCLSTIAGYMVYTQRWKTFVIWNNLMQTIHNRNMKPESATEEHNSASAHSSVIVPSENANEHSAGRVINPGESEHTPGQIIGPSKKSK